MIKTLEEIRRERGQNVHGFVLIITGALPEDQSAARQICGTIQGLVDKAMTDMETATRGDLEVTSLSLRMETADQYIAAGMPHGSNSQQVPLRREKKAVHPDDFVCAVCGGGYIPETIGMFAGKRYIHTCGD